jgi:hypothetical protein
VQDARTIERTAAAADRRSVAVLLAVRYREVLRARFLADRIKSDPRSAERLEERVHRFEEAAASVELPSRWYFLESARLIRSGDLTGAKSAFDAATAALAVDAASAPAAVDVAVLPPAVEFAVSVAAKALLALGS